MILDIVVACIVFLMLCFGAILCVSSWWIDRNFSSYFSSPKKNIPWYVRFTIWAIRYEPNNDWPSGKMFEDNKKDK